jgi:hypothetical protein
MTLHQILAVHRRAASLAIVQTSGKAAKVLESRVIARPPGTRLEGVVSALLETQPPETKRFPLSVLLSATDTACSDAWVLPEGLSSRDARKLLPALLEARCAGEAIEDLVVDFSVSGHRVQALAVPRAALVALEQSLRGYRLRLVTSIPSAVSRAFPGASFTFGGDRLDATASAVRSYPVNGPDAGGLLRLGDLDVPVGQVAALAGAICEPDHVPNLVHAVQGSPSLLGRLVSPLANLASAAALCLVALGMRWHLNLQESRRGIEMIRKAENGLWAKFLPSEEPRAAALVRAMKRRISELGESPGELAIPSALSFWAEIARQLPDVEGLGLTLEAMDLLPEGGRLSARVSSDSDDPLRNASRLEADLNRSERLKARADYEVREGQVQVRLRMDYKP